VAGFSRQDLFGGINFEDIFGGLNFNFGGGSPMEWLFHRRPAGPRRGENIELELHVPLERVVNGGEEKVSLTRPTTCAACHGTGEKNGASPPQCEMCGGTGRITRSRREEQEHLLIQQVSICPACQGRGRVSRHPCPACGGKGRVEQEESLTVKIPVGVEEGMALRIPGKGMSSPDAGGVAGDLFVVVYARHDPRFERVGVDLLRHEALELTDAVLGTTLQVPTLDGSASVTVPPGTQPNAVLRLKGKGLPAFGGGHHGDLYLRLDVRIPQHLTREERELYERLRALAGKAH
jgi:molecular chaperone DnaJ